MENKKTVLILSKTNKTSFGLLFVNPILFSLSYGQWNSSCLICAFNISQRKEFKGKGEVEAVGDEWDYIWIGDGEVGIRLQGKGDYYAYSKSHGEILHITEDVNGINAIT